jgi:hypothetical protein
MMRWRQLLCRLSERGDGLGMPTSENLHMDGSLAAILTTDAEPNSVVPTSAFQLA